jgi:hypothetical protein
MVAQFEKDKVEMKKFFSKLAVRPCCVVDLWKGMLAALLMTYFSFHAHLKGKTACIGNSGLWP